MDELKRKVMDVIDGINNEWVDTLKTAEEKNTGIDMSEMMGKYSTHIKKLDQHFIEARERVIGQKKKGLW